jgi:hypothetical protein
MHLIKIVLSITLITLFAGCEKEQSLVHITPEVYFGNRGIVIDWEPSGISGFSYYEVLRSTDGIRFTTVNNIDSINSPAFEIDSTSFTDIPYPFEDILYYRVAVMGEDGKELEVSKKVSIVVPKPIELEFDPTEAYIIPEKNEILFFLSAWDNTYFYLFDYENKEIIKLLKLKIISTGYAQGFGKFNNKYEFYFNDGSDFKMLIYDALTFNYISSFSFSAAYTQICSDFSKYIYYQNFDNIYIVDRTTLESKKYNSNNNYFQEMYYMDGVNRLIGFTNDRILLFDLDNEGNITNETYKDVENPYYYHYITGTKYIYGWDYSESKIVNTDTWEEQELKDEYNNSRDFSLFHAKNGVLYAYKNRRIYCYRLDNLELTEVFPTRVEPRIILSDDKDLILIQSSFSGRTIIDKMKLSE